MITAEPGTPLGYICEMVDNLKPGECLKVDRFQMREVPVVPGWMGGEFEPQDRVMENIVGSAYSIHMSVSPEDGGVTFCKHPEGEQRKRLYTSPDCRPGGSKFEELDARVRARGEEGLKR